jgi:FkbM family methyltransferase
MFSNFACVSTINGTFAISNHSDEVSNELLVTGIWKRELQRITKLLLEGVDSPVVIDIGAHLGAYSIPIAIYLSDKGGEVIGFEVRRFQYYQLCANILLNRLENFIPYNVAIGGQEKMIEIPEFYCASAHQSSRFSIEPDYRSKAGIDSDKIRRFTSIPLWSLQSIRCRGKVNLLKIDAEGVELDILKGGGNFFAMHGFPPILLKVSSESWCSENKTNCIRLLETLGYILTELGHNDLLAQHPSYHIQVGFFDGQHGIEARRLNYSPENIISIMGSLDMNMPLENQLKKFGVTVGLYNEWKARFCHLSLEDVIRNCQPHNRHALSN